MKNLWLCVIAGLLPLQAMALTGEEAMRRSQAAFLYPGKDFKARVVMKLINKDGQERVRELTMLRKNIAGPGGEQKYFMYFFQPADVRDMTFMIHKYPAKDDDRWLFVPAINMVKRIAAQDKRSSFVGSDFTYEDVSGRDIEDDVHVIEREEKLGNRDCYVVKSTPRGQGRRFRPQADVGGQGEFPPAQGGAVRPARGEIQALYGRGGCRCPGNSHGRPRHHEEPAKRAPHRGRVRQDRL